MDNAVADVATIGDDEAVRLIMWRLVALIAVVVDNKEDIIILCP